MEAELYVVASPDHTFFGAGTMFAEIEYPVAETPNLTVLPAGLRERVTFDQSAGKLIVRGAVTPENKADLEKCFETPRRKKARRSHFPFGQWQRHPFRRREESFGFPCWRSG